MKTYSCEDYTRRLYKKIRAHGQNSFLTIPSFLNSFHVLQLIRVSHTPLMILKTKLIIKICKLKLRDTIINCFQS